MEDLSLHILDIAENSIAAKASQITVTIVEDSAADRYSVEVADDGSGMDQETAERVSDPFFTTKTVRRVGLGVPLLKQAAEECGGSFSLVSEKGKGTTITAVFRRSHIDRKPLGDLGATFMVLVAGNPLTDFTLEYRRDGYSFSFGTALMRRELGEVPLNTPVVLEIIRSEIRDGLDGWKKEGTFRYA
jgi:hypothetical protein